MTSDVPSLRTYIAGFAMLLGLTALTTAVAHVDLGSFNLGRGAGYRGVKGPVSCVLFHAPDVHGASYTIGDRSRSAVARDSPSSDAE